MMDYLFVAEHRPIKELLAAVEAFKTEGYDTDNVRLGVTWDEFLAAVPDQSTVVVYSVDFFPSLMELLGTLAALHERGIALRSIREPWLTEPCTDTAQLLVALRQLAFTLHATQTKRGLQKARTAGRTIGRPRK